MTYLVNTLVELYKAHPLAQLVGLVAMIVTMFGFHGKSSRTIVRMLSLSSFVWTLHFLLLDAPAGALLNALAVPRNLIFSCRGRHRWAESIGWPILFSAFYIAAGTWSFMYRGEGAISFLSTAAQVIGTFALRMTNPKAVRWLSIPISLMWMLYDVISGSIPGVINEIFCQISLCLAIFRFRSRKPATGSAPAA